ncbi:MAG: glycosyl hydrolase 115 family protein [Filimonas sp.]|nr:glycosyl hydrolase 115 family protein [Filimonas sp.]
MKKLSLLIVLLMSLSFAFAKKDSSYISFEKISRAFPLVTNGNAVGIYISTNEYAGVVRAVKNMQTDINAVTNIQPNVSTESPTGNAVVIIGTVGKNEWIDALIKEKKIDGAALQNKWEKFIVQTIDKPFKGVDKAVVIAGSDKRGTIYGIYDLSAKIGVSPWYWWADVPVVKHTSLFVQPGIYTAGEPEIKYRGIFINDEAPALSGWTKEKFGGFNHLFYEKVFELILRLKGNYLWPAMWGNAFNDDDTLNPVLADEYGIVMGTSHHEPMMRAQQEWKRYGKGEWNYDHNKEVLQNFWRKGIQNMKSHESIVSIGMRGDGDMPMTEGSNIALLERIVKDQRTILEEVTGKPAKDIPQSWALYKEVQDYYDKGMRVPDDVTLLLCDDNWGNIRKLPKLNEPKRAGGYGIYYHFDYVGGPRNYKWLNTNPISKVWEQMHLAYEYNARQIWIVNVGDIKPMEFPISFFLDYAWAPSKMDIDDLDNYTTRWSSEQFGMKYAGEIADIINKYTKYNGRRKPELLSPDTYSLLNYNEANRVADAYNQLATHAQSIYDKLDEKYKDAYYQLVLFPVKACANLNELYVTVAKNRHYAKQYNGNANAMADKAVQLYANDSLLSLYYNKTLAGGKWNHMMDQTHIGYTYWQQPDKNVMPAVVRLASSEIKNNDVLTNSTTANDGYKAIEAAHFSRAINKGEIKVKILPGYGRTLSGVTFFPVTAKPSLPLNDAPRLEYDITIKDTGYFAVHCYISPTIDFTSSGGLKYAISVDNEKPQIVNIEPDTSEKAWEKGVADNIRILVSKHHFTAKGKHTLKFWRVDPAVVLQKIVIDFGGLKESYLGPEE